MAVRKRNGGFQVDFMHRGSRYREQFATLEEAEVWEANAQIALKHGHEVPKAGQKAAKGRNQLFTLQGLFDHVKATAWIGAKSERDLVRNGQCVVDRFGPARPVAEITKFDIDCWIAEMKSEGRNTGGTINRKLAALSKMLTVAAESGVIAQRPKWKRQREAEGRLRYLEVPEEQAIVRTLRLWSRDMEASLTEFLVDTGLRVGEALDLVWSQDHGNYIEVVGAADRRQDTKGSKSGRTRRVPLTPRARAVLTDLRQTEAKGPFREMSYRSFEHYYRKVLQHLKIDQDGVSIHTLRHTAASRLVMKGVDLNRVRVFLGHSNVKTTMIYAHLAPDSLDPLADVLGSYSGDVIEIAERRKA
jgi:integrase